MECVDPEWTAYRNLSTSALSVILSIQLASKAHNMSVIFFLQNLLTNVKMFIILELLKCIEEKSMICVITSYLQETMHFCTL